MLNAFIKAVNLNIYLVLISTLPLCFCGEHNLFTCLSFPEVRLCIYGCNTMSYSGYVHGITAKTLSMLFGNSILSCVHSNMCPKKMIFHFHNALSKLY